MTHLKRNKIKIAFLSILALQIQSCSTSSFYKHDKQWHLASELLISPDRISLECAKISDENELYMFMVHVLDNQNTVMTASQGNNSDQKTCLWRKDIINKIVRNGKRIYLAGMGDPNEPRQFGKEAELIRFEKRGTFPHNHRFLQLMFISNENGACYGAYTALEKPCPQQPFPLPSTSLVPN